MINANAYSLWLNDLDASTGSILFGGVDSDKYHGELQTLPIIPERGQFAEFIIALTGMGLNGQKDSLFQNENVPVLLDSGSSLMYLPDNLVRSLYGTFDARYDASIGAAYVDCDLGNQEGSLEFDFSGVIISVRMSELVILGAVSRGQPICILGIGLAGDSVAVLGDTFLRSAYVVYDLENNEISLAQTNFNATSENISEIKEGKDGVPDATDVPNAVSTAAVGTGGPRIDGPNIIPTGTGGAGGNGQGSEAAAMPYPTANAWAGAAIAGAGIMLGFNGF
jgi:hypothetical protein